MGDPGVMKRGWNPKRLGVVRSQNGSYETDVWLYLSRSGILDIVIENHEGGVVKGTTVHSVTIPATRASRVGSGRRGRKER